MKFILGLRTRTERLGKYHDKRTSPEIHIEIVKDSETKLGRLR